MERPPSNRRMRESMEDQWRMRCCYQSTESICICYQFDKMVVPCYLNVHITAILTSLMADTFHFTFYLFLFNSFVRSFLSFSLRVNEPCVCVWRWCDGARVMVVHVWFRFPLVSIWVFNQHARNDIPIIILINQNGWRLCCLSKWL